MTRAAQDNADQRCFGARACAEVKRLAAVFVVVALVAIAGKYYCFDRLNEEIRVRIERALQSHYQGLKVTVRSARCLAGQGIEIRGVRIAEGGRQPIVIAEIDEIMARCDTRPPNFLTTLPPITAIDVQRLKLRAERKPSARWNIAHLWPLPPCECGSAPVVTISDASLEIVDSPQLAESASGGLMLRNIGLTIQPQSGDSSGRHLRIRGTLGGDHLEQVEIDGTLDPVLGDWDIRGAVAGLEFSPRLRAALPRELAVPLAPLSSIRGRTYFGFHASQSFKQKNPAKGSFSPIEFVVHGKIAEGRIDDARLPESLTDVEATIRCDNHGLLIDELSARCGQTHLSLSATVAGWHANQPIDIALTAKQLDLSRLPWTVFPPSIQNHWNQFQPRGLADVSGRLRFDGHQWQPELAIDCHDLSLCYERFKYRLTDGSGTIVVKPDWLSVRLAMLGGGQPITCQADIRDPGPHFYGNVQVRSERPITIDEKLLIAIGGPMQPLVRSFQPRGAISFTARFERQRGQSTVNRLLDVTLHECSIQHDRFPYPIDRVGGTLSMTNDNWRFLSLKGTNDSAEITGEGSWSATADKRLALSFIAKNVPLADELRQALSPATQRLWSHLQPRGNIDDLAVNLSYEAATRKWSIDVRGEKRPAVDSAEGRSISLTPTWFSYGLNNVSGSFRYRDGQMELSNLRAEHGRATITAAGNCAIFPGGGCQLQLTRLAADLVQADDEFLGALPHGLGRSLGRVPLEGPLNVLGTLVVAVPAQPDAAVQFAWDLNLDVENGRLATETPLEHIHGGMRLTGRQSPEGLFAHGELLVDSTIVRGVQLTGVQGPFWFDGRRLVFGALAERDAQHRAPRQVTANTLAGLLSLDGEVALDTQGAFDVRATLANADLAQISQQIAPQQPPPSGKAFGLVNVRGSRQGKHTWQGDGQISLREANLYELPAMITLLKLLSVQRPNTTAFTNCNVIFRIEGDDLAFDRIDFSGDAISLKGKGRMNGQRQIDLKFYPLVGREERQLPFLRPLLGQTGQELMLIEATGTLDQPEIRRTPFPRLDAQLAQLFPELAPAEAVETKAPPVRSAADAWNRWRPSAWR